LVVFDLSSPWIFLTSALEITDWCDSLVLQPTGGIFAGKTRWLLPAFLVARFEFDFVGVLFATASPWGGERCG
jgi:hypothetical protein